MTTNEVPKLEEPNRLLQTRTKATYNAALFIVIPLIAGFLAERIVLQGSGIFSMGISPAIGLSMGVCLVPNIFRTRSGSLLPAICLVVTMWIAALVSIVFYLLG